MNNHIKDIINELPCSARLERAISQRPIQFIELGFFLSFRYHFNLFAVLNKLKKFSPVYSIKS